MRLGELVAGMVAWALLAAAGAAVAGSPQGAASGMEAPCPTTEVIFRLVPGRFDYCVARKRWAQGDYAGAREMLLIAARWSDKNAQLALGAAYLQGVGFRQDRPLGLAWLMLACERHVAPYQVLCDESLHAASSAELRLARTQLALLRPRYGDDAVAARAYRRYQTEAASMAGNPAYGGACIAGLDLIVPGNPAGDPPGDPDGCGIGSQMRTAAAVDQLRQDYFAGWKGAVRVGSPEQAAR